MQLERVAADYLQHDKLSPVDETPKPAWGTGPDGRSVNIEADIRFGQIFTEWQADACRHEKTGIVRWINAGNQVCYNWFCAHCGLKLSSNIPHSAADAHGVVKATLDDLASRTKSYVAQRQLRLDAMIYAAAERVQPATRQDYSDYLRSPAWRALRDKVLDRARGVCEGCLDARAEHVHHKSYDHKGSEFAFELLALCAGCHHRLHDREP